MKNKQTKYLIGLLIIITAVLIADLLLNNQQSGNLKQTLVQVDSAKIAEITFYPKTKKNKITLKKENDSWFVISAKGKYEADQDKVASIIHTLLDLHPDQAVGNTRKDWLEYGTVDTNSINVIVKNNRGRTVAHLYIGKIESSMQPQGYPYGNVQRQYSTYVRVKGDRHVYLVPKLLAIDFISDADAYRNHTLTAFDPDQVQQIRMKLKDSEFVLSRKDGHWYLDTLLADSARVEEYLQDISHIDGWQFADKEQASKLKSLDQLTVDLQDNQQIVVKAMGDTAVKVLWSSQNPDAYFQAQGLDKKFFPGREIFNGK